MAIQTVPRIRHRHVEVDGVRVFYRESLPAGPTNASADADADADAPVMLLLHGFPSASHQFRRLMDALGAHYRLIALSPQTPGAADTVRSLLVLPATRGQYEGGTTDPELVAPDGWTLDQHFLDLPGRTRPQLDLAFDYHSNVALYPQWQTWLREHTPPTLIVWGTGDKFFPEPGARAYLRDLPDAELHLFDTGHFALEDRLPEIAPLIAGFLDRTWEADRP